MKLAAEQKNGSWMQKKFYKLVTNAKKYFAVRCNKCHWQGCRSKVFGGTPMADTGDYSEIECPKCNSVDLDDAVPDFLNPWFLLRYYLKKPIIIWQHYQYERAVKRWAKELDEGDYEL